MFSVRSHPSSQKWQFFCVANAHSVIESPGRSQIEILPLFWKRLHFNLSTGIYPNAYLYIVYVCTMCCCFNNTNNLFFAWIGWTSNQQPTTTTSIRCHFINVWMCNKSVCIACTMCGVPFESVIDIQNHFESTISSIDLLTMAKWRTILMSNVRPIKEMTNKYSSGKTLTTQCHQNGCKTKAPTTTDKLMHTFILFFFFPFSPLSPFHSNLPISQPKSINSIFYLSLTNIERLMMVQGVD